MVAAHRNLTTVAAGIIRKTPVLATMGAGTRTTAHTAEILTKTGLNTRDIPITGTTNVPVSQSEVTNSRCNHFGLAIAPAQTFA